MKSSHPNPQQDGYNLQGFPDQNCKTQNNNDQISARNNRVYFSKLHPATYSTTSFVPVQCQYVFLSTKHVALPTGFGGRILNLGNNKSYLRWDIWSHWIRFRFPLVVKLWQRRSLSRLPPVDFGVEANGFVYCPTACTYSSELVRGKQGVYISGQSAKRNYLLQNSNIHVLPLRNTTHILCLVLEIKLWVAGDQQVILSV